MAAIQRAPWSLRSYAALIVALALLSALAVGGEQSLVRVLWAGAFGIAACTGNRIIWWLLVAGNVLALVAAPVLFSDWWLSIPLSLVGLALLLAPESRRYVFERSPKAIEGSDA
jgi:hypothetical protein